MAENLKAVEDGNRRLEAMAESKLLEYHAGKSGMIIIGGRKFIKETKESLAKKPVIFCGKPMTVFDSERYLGDILGSSLPQSVFLTILKRKGLVLKLISEIRVTIDDCRSSSVGGLIVGLDIWRKAVVPFLYNNCECWVQAPKKALDLLDSLTHSLFRSLFHAAKGNPLVMYYWDTGSLLNSNFIMLKKLSFLYHLESLPNSALAKEILNIQKEEVNNFQHTNFVSECNMFLEELNITSSPTSYSKSQWSKLLKQKIHQKNERDLRSQMATYVFKARY